MTWTIAGFAVFIMLAGWYGCKALDAIWTQRKEQTRDGATTPRVVPQAAGSRLRPLAPSAAAAELSRRVALRRLDLAAESSAERRRPVESPSAAETGLSSESCYRGTHLSPKGDAA